MIFTVKEPRILFKVIEIGEVFVSANGLWVKIRPDAAGLLLDKDGLWYDGSVSSPFDSDFPVCKIKSLTVEVEG